MNIKNNITNTFRNIVSSFTKNSAEKGLADPYEFFRNGPRRMPATWSMAEISDKDFYTGYGFAVVNKRANRSVVLGKRYLFTDAKESVIADANEKGERIIHPYLDLIRDSIDFSERDFWYSISTYLDLEGVYYLMAVRAVSPSGRVGHIQKFSLLNPYNVRAVTNPKGEVGGYVEQINGLVREIPKEMIIPIRLFNPFDPSKPYSLADAARDAQFTMKQANDFAREAIDGNLNSPGILSSSIELPEDQFDNFVERVKYHGRGEPLFGNGSGALSWIDMQTDLDKAALDKINSISRDALLAVSGLSKTGVGVEESGTGREVSRTQKDDFTENAVMPQVENIIDALNLDYRRYYADEYKKTKYNIALDNPLETDRDAERADVEIRREQFALMQEALNAGYSYEVASKYARGVLNITDLGVPGEKAPEEPEDSEETPEETPDEPKEQSSTAYKGYPIPVLQYLAGYEVESSTEEGSVIHSTHELDINSPVRISEIKETENKLIAEIDNSTYIELGKISASTDKPAVLAKLNKRYKNQLVAIKNKLDEAEILQEAVERAEDNLFDEYLKDSPDASRHIQELSLAFTVYYTALFPTYAAERARQTAKELDRPVRRVELTDRVRQSIQNFSFREAESHINTILMDLENAKASGEPLKQAFEEIKARRAPAIAENAAARVLSFSRYEADLQVLAHEGLLDKAYKELHSLTGEPCEFCKALIAKGPIPFVDNFVDKGTTISVDGKSMNFDYEDISAGNVHPNCNCAYRLVIED
jgi:hypothetical protein